MEVHMGLRLDLGWDSPTGEEAGPGLSHSLKRLENSRKALQSAEMWFCGRSFAGPTLPFLF